jgi:antitoxin component YwqK of YwqJK toxin-antitoxin module
MKKILISFILFFSIEANAQNIVELAYGDTSYMTIGSSIFVWGDYFLKDSLADGLYIVYQNKYVVPSKLDQLGRSYYTDTKYRNTKHIECKARYVNGKKTGVVEYYSYPPSDDRTQNVESAFLTYSNGILDGTFKVYDGKKIKQSGKYSQTRKDSIWETYTEGVLRSRAVYSMDTLLQIDKWFANGNKDCSWSFAGREYKQWHGNGQKKTVVIFNENGIAETHRYDDHGNEIQGKVLIPREIRQTYEWNAIFLSW